jgi:hypothetical protein
MKITSLIACFMLLCSGLTYAQQDSVAIPDQTPKDSIVNTWQLEHDAWIAWERIDSIWTDSIYWKCLKRHKLKMKCSGCEYIMIHVDLIIDTNGKLTGYAIEKSNICGNDISKEMEKEFMEFFQNLIFPEILRGMKLHTMLGTGLKC